MGSTTIAEAVIELRGDLNPLKRDLQSAEKMTGQAGQRSAQQWARTISSTSRTASRALTMVAAPAVAILAKSVHSFAKSASGGELRTALKGLGESYAEFGGKVSRAPIMGKNVTEWIGSFNKALASFDQGQVNTIVRSVTALAVAAGALKALSVGSRLFGNVAGLMGVGGKAGVGAGGANWGMAASTTSLGGAGFDVAGYMRAGQIQKAIATRQPGSIVLSGSFGKSALKKSSLKRRVEEELNRRSMDQSIIPVRSLYRGEARARAYRASMTEMKRHNRTYTPEMVSGFFGSERRATLPRVNAWSRQQGITSGLAGFTGFAGLKGITEMFKSVGTLAAKAGIVAVLAAAITASLRVIGDSLGIDSFKKFLDFLGKIIKGIDTFVSLIEGSIRGIGNVFGRIAGDLASGKITSLKQIADEYYAGVETAAKGFEKRHGTSVEKAAEEALAMAMGQQLDAIDKAFEKRTGIKPKARQPWEGKKEDELTPAMNDAKALWEARRKREEEMAQEAEKTLRKEWEQEDMKRTLHEKQAEVRKDMADAAEDERRASVSYHEKASDLLRQNRRFKEDYAKDSADLNRSREREVEDENLSVKRFQERIRMRHGVKILSSAELWTHMQERFSEIRKQQKEIGFDREDMTSRAKRSKQDYETRQADIKLRGARFGEDIRTDAQRTEAARRNEETDYRKKSLEYDKSIDKNAAEFNRGMQRLLQVALAQPQEN